jgi:hypothetical protein
MTLLVRGTDIQSVTFGLQRAGQEWLMVTLPARPEGYLAALEGFLRQEKCSKEDIRQVIIVSGEGSATAVRASVTLVNTLAWANGWAMSELIVPAKATVADVQAAAPQAQLVAVARPNYASAPHITQSTHDALKRKL